jgi:ABC-2 type transport system permease protein
MKTLRHMLIKEFIQIRRDKRMRPIIIVAPILMTIILGYAATVDVVNVGLVVCDLDNSPESRELVERFTTTGTFSVVASVDDPAAIDAYFDDARAIVAVVLPRGFGKDLAGGRPTTLQLLADGADANTANISLNYARQITLGFSQALLIEQVMRRGGSVRVPQVEAETRIWYNPDLRSANYMVPAVVAMILMLITTTFTSVAIVKEREMGTMEQLIVTPMTRAQLMLGKLLPYVVIGFMEAVVVLTVAVLWFGIALKGSIVLLFALAALFILTTLGLGLFVSTISHTQQQAMMTAQFFVFFPMLFLSGFTFPIENMPVPIQVVTYIIPLRYFLEIIRGVVLKGVGIETLWPQALALLLIGITVLSLAVSRFQKRLG